MMFTDENGQLTKDAYDFLFAVFQRIGGSLDSLNAATLQGHTWEEPGTIGALTPNIGRFTTLESTGLSRLNSLRVTSGFGCNSQPTRGPYPLGSTPAFDLPTTMNLANALRLALINNGIGSNLDS